MNNIENSSKIGTRAVKKLREQKLKSGLPFMINTKELSSDQCYMEYPNGTINLISLSDSGSDVEVIRELSAIEARELRNRFRISAMR